MSQKYVSKSCPTLHSTKLSVRLPVKLLGKLLVKPSMKLIEKLSVKPSMKLLEKLSVKPSVKLLGKLLGKLLKWGAMKLAVTRLIFYYATRQIICQQQTNT